MAQFPPAASLAQAVALACAAPRLKPIAAPPCAPEPFSDAEIARILASTPRRAPSKSDAGAHASTFTETFELPLIEGADLATLTDRFEHSLARRTAVIQAEEAHHILAANLPLARPDDALRTALRAQHTVTAVSEPAASSPETPPDAADPWGLRQDCGIRDALDHALATLRALAQNGRR